MKKPRLVLAGAHSGVGKTSVSAGIMAALVRRGLAVQPYKVGPDYIDPAFHTFVTHRPSRNLDSWMLSEATIRTLFRRNAPGPDEGLSVIEGVMGLFDGHISDAATAIPQALGRVAAESSSSPSFPESLGSTAHVASVLAAPIVLIINGAGLARSAAALVSGFDRFRPETRLAGVIVNQVSGRGHYELLKQYIEREAGVPCFGFLPKNPQFALESRHLGLVPSGEVAGLAERLSALAEAARETVDLDGLLRLAAEAPELAAPPAPFTAGPAVRLGVARDRAFNFYYEDSLDLLRALGAELIFFSPLEDTALPSGLDGLYLGGGFPEVFAADLAANTALRREVKDALEGGLPAYAECGGLMYLSKHITTLDGTQHPMVGFFEESVTMTGRLQNFGYVELTFQRDTVLGPAGTRVRAHEFHHSRLEGSPDYALEVRKSAARAWPGGLVKKNVLAAYPHLHLCANTDIPQHFLQECLSYRG